jgi:hypothetical protein
MAGLETRLTGSSLAREPAAFHARSPQVHRATEKLLSNSGLMDNRKPDHAGWRGDLGMGLNPSRTLQRRKVGFAKILKNGVVLCCLALSLMEHQ